MEKEKFKKDKRKKKRFYCNKNKQQQNNRIELENDNCGFLITCNQKEYQCLQESYNILNELSELLYPNLYDNDNEIDKNDIEACIKQEILNEQKNNRKFLQIKTNCKNFLFIRIQNDKIDPQFISKNLFNLNNEQKRINCRYIQRILPVIKTCRTDKIEKKFTEIFDQYATKKCCSYIVECRIKNYTSLNEYQLKKLIINIVRELRPNWYVNLNDPEQFISINVLCKATCISLLCDYNKNCKYNLIEFIRKNHHNDNYNNNDRSKSEINQNETEKVVECK